MELLELTRACDAMILPITPEVMSLERLRRTAEVINGVSQRRTRIRVLLSMVRDVASPQGKLGWSDYERVTCELMEA